MKFVIDSSALIAIALNEPERDLFIARIDSADEVFCSMVTLYETGVVLIRKKIGTNTGHAMALAEQLGIQIIPFVEAHLNFGDCVSYALAKALDAPLLYKGDDFAATDIASL